MSATLLAMTLVCAASPKVGDRIRIDSIELEQAVVEGQVVGIPFLATYHCSIAQLLPEARYALACAIVESNALNWGTGAPSCTAVTDLYGSDLNIECRNSGAGPDATTSDALRDLWLVSSSRAGWLPLVVDPDLRSQGESRSAEVHTDEYDGAAYAEIVSASEHRVTLSTEDTFIVESRSPKGPVTFAVAAAGTRYVSLDRPFDWSVDTRFFKQVKKPTLRLSSGRAFLAMTPQPTNGTLESKTPWWYR